MRTLGKLALMTFAVGIMVTFAMPAAFAHFVETDLGTHSQEEVRVACNSVHKKPGQTELLGVNKYGSYGCENHDKNTMITCNKSEECTGHGSVKATKSITLIRFLSGEKD